MNLKSTFLFCSIFTLVFSLQAQRADISNFRPNDKTGVNVFESPKTENETFDGLGLRIGANFTQQFQGLNHSNTLADIDGDGIADNSLISLKSGFNLATANLNIDVQLEEGITLNLVTYLSSRHHPESWVKGGYIQFDRLKFLKSEAVNNFMKYATLKIGHMEVNYGDSHFRRTDNGNAIYNPFVGNYILDAFNTEIGGELYVRNNGLMVMLGMTGGEINGNVGEARTSDNDDSAKRSPSIIGKLAYDRELSEDLRLRLSSSVYHTASSAVNHLYDGDRAGSRYYLVMEAPDAIASKNFRSGRYNPGFTDKLTAIMANVFLKYQGVEFFGTYETANGRNWVEKDTRNVRQLAADVVYRFGVKENVYVAARYNMIDAEDPSGQAIKIERFQGGAGWFITNNILLKGEYVKQNYSDFPNTSLFYEGLFDGVIVEAVVAF